MRFHINNNQDLLVLLLREITFQMTHGDADLYLDIGGQMPFRLLALGASKRPTKAYAQRIIY
jgi:hypothetical protein